MAESAGAYWLQITSLEDTNKNGQFEIKLSAARAASSSDQVCIQGGIELLTVSGCDTALGSKIDSDDRGPIDDADIARPMQNFYERWMGSPGMAKSQALRQAQRAGKAFEPLLLGTVYPGGNWKSLFSRCRSAVRQCVRSFRLGCMLRK